MKAPEMGKSFRIDIYVPEDHAEKVKEAAFRAGGGRIGNYECCCWQTPGEGQFKPLEGSTPFIGSRDTLEKVREIKIEMVCAPELAEKVIGAIKEAHPYETPAFQYWEVNT